MGNEVKRIHGGFKNVPEHLLTKTRLAERGLRPGGPPKAEYWVARQWALLYDINEAVPKRVANEKQLAALEKGRKTIEENRTCDVCRCYLPKDDIRKIDDEKICKWCYRERKEEEYLRSSKEFLVEVAGTYYIEDSILDKMKKDTVLKLERQPDNPHDNDAIKVMASLGSEWEKIGYVPARYAEIIAPRIDSDEFVGIQNLGISTREWERFISYEEISVETSKVVDIRIYFEQES